MTLKRPLQRRLPIVLGLFFLAIVGASACTSSDTEPASSPPPAPVPAAASAPTAPAAAPPAPAPTVSTPAAPAPAEPAPAVVAQATDNLVPSIPTPEPTSPPAPLLTAFDAADLAPDLTDTGEWINSEPLTSDGLRSEGKVVLIDFWTYTCINCIRTLPYLKEWHEKYTDNGLVILGVHTPEFEFEKVYENVVEAVAKFGLEYPIVQDNDFGTWNAFNNRFWPAKYLIDVNGFIRYSHFGEGAYDETEQQIRDLLIEAGYNLEGISISTEPEPQVDADAMSAAQGVGRTRELYAGYERNFGALRSFSTSPYIRHVEYYEATDEVINYTDPGDHENHFLYLQGLWKNQADNLVHAQMTKEYEDYIVIQFYATSVHAVMAPDTGEPFQVKVTLDDAPVEMSRAGIDIQYDQEGNSFIKVEESRMYSLVNQPTFSGGELKLSSNSSEFSFFAFTFGAYEGGEPVKGS